jgi:hypothetical protein
MQSMNSNWMIALSTWLAFFLAARLASAGRDSGKDYVGMVDPYIMSACGRWFFFGTGKRPFAMVNVFPDTRNALRASGKKDMNIRPMNSAESRCRSPAVRLESEGISELNLESIPR